MPSLAFAVVADGHFWKASDQWKKLRETERCHCNKINVSANFREDNTIDELDIESNKHA